MDRHTKRHFGVGIAIAFIIALGLVEYTLYKYGEISVSKVSITFAGTIIGILIAYFMYHSFFEKEVQMSFIPGEHVILQRKQPERSVLIPQIMGTGDNPDHTPSEVNLYLTNIGIVAEEPGTGEPLIYIPYKDIQELQTVNKMLLKYIRVRFIDTNGSLSEIMIYVGKETDVWAENISKMRSQ